MSVPDGAAFTVGVNSWSMQSTYMRPRPHAELYAECLREAQLAESLGFDSFFMGEHHFAYDGYCPSLMAVASRLLAATTDLVVGTGIVLLPLHGAQRIAEAAAAISSFAPGRLRIGVAGGWREVEYLGSGLQLGDRARLMEEYLAALVDGEYAQHMTSTDILVGGGSKAALRRAGRYGLSPLLAYAGPAEAAERRAIWEAALRPNPRQRRLATIRDVWVAEDPERQEWIRRRLEEMWRFYARFDDATVRQHHVPGETPQEEVEANIPSMMAYGTLGGVEQVLEELTEIVKTGVNDLILRVRFDGIDSVYVRECMTVLATDVVPALRSTAAAR
jgi:alkanesulfonate monooxygenase SsuD/methylene tetrahydromethanopterin reductase-like flavin-dependent oxidoreductase (luciferase family)